MKKKTKEKLLYIFILLLLTLFIYTFLNIYFNKINDINNKKIILVSEEYKN